MMARQFFHAILPPATQISSSSLFLSTSPADGSFLTVVPLRIGIEGIPPRLGYRIKSLFDCTFRKDNPTKSFRLLLSYSFLSTICAITPVKSYNYLSHNLERKQCLI